MLSKQDVLDSLSSGSSLSGADLSWLDLSGVDFADADLSHATLTGADLSSCVFKGANLESAFLPEANLSKAKLEETNLKHAFLQRTICNSIIIIKSDLSYSNCPLACFDDAKLNFVVANKASFIDSSFDRIHFDNCDFSYSIFRGSSIQNAIFRKVSFAYADIRKVKLNHSSFTDIEDTEVLFYGKYPWSSKGVTTKRDWDKELPYYQDD